MDADEGRGGARDEDADLVNCVVGAVEGAVFVEGRGVEGEEEGGCDALVYGVFGNVDKEKGEHAVKYQKRRVKTRDEGAYYGKNSPRARMRLALKLFGDALPPFAGG